MAYLKSSLPDNAPTICTIIERLPSSQGQYGVKFPYKIEMNGVIYDHEATMSEEKGLQKFQPGMTAEVVKKGNSFGTISLYWNMPGAAPQNRSTGPTPQATQDLNRVVAEQKEADEKRKQREAVSKIIFGYMNTEMARGKTPAEAKATAMEAHRLQEQACTEILTGIPPAPTQDSTSLPS